MDIKEEHVLPDDVVLQNERDFFTMKTNSDDVTIKTEIKSETLFINHLGKEINKETATCSNNWDIHRQQTLVSDFGSENEHPAMNDKKYVDDEIYNKMEIKVEPWWLETETSTACGDIEDGDLAPVECSRLCAETVSGDGSGNSPLSYSEVLGRDTNICDGKDHLEFEHQKIDGRELPTAEARVPSEQSDKCDEGEMYIRPLLLKQESFIPKGKSPHECNICNKSFTHLSYLNRHTLIHEGKKPHKCNTCGKSFTLLSHLKTHNLIHEGKKPHQCNTCYKRFTHLSHLKTHNLIHEGKKPHQCKICNKSFTHLSNLKTHYLVHEGKKPHQCKTCYKSFTHLSHLKTHNLNHEGKKPHQCNTCYKSFTCLSNLKTHNLIHEGKKPHQCKTCDKSFTRLSHLKTHNLIHEGKKPHQCKICDKSFTQLSTLITHNLIHEGRKPHQCRICNKSFSRLSHLKRHNLVHERSEHKL